jgi:hypothetical protein
MPSSAWIEPGTASLFLYCSTLLIRGRGGARILSRHLWRAKETVTDVALDEFSDLLCDHPDMFLTILLVSGSFLSGPDGAPRCRLVARAPAIVRSTRTLSRSATKAIFSRLSNYESRANGASKTTASNGVFSDVNTGVSNGCPSAASKSEFRFEAHSQHTNKLLHFLRRSDPPPIKLNLQQTQEEPEESRSIRLGTLPANPLRLPVFFCRAGRRKGPALHLMCQLAAKGIRSWKKKNWSYQKTDATDGSSSTFHAGAWDHPVP